jgi:hypothetical protein
LTPQEGETIIQLLQEPTTQKPFPHTPNSNFAEEAKLLQLKYPNETSEQNSSPPKPNIDVGQAKRLFLNHLLLSKMTRIEE